MTISGCIKAKNEEKLLPGWIENIKDFVDEIIVVDNGSTDRTAEIARKKGARVISSPDLLVDQNANKFVDAAKSDWLLVVDADERFDSDAKKRIRTECETVDPSIYGLLIPEYQYLGSGQFVETTAMRIFRNHKGIRYNSFTIHASVSDSIVECGGKIKKIFAPLHHFDMLLGGRAGKKRKLYVENMENNIAENPNHPRIWFQYVLLAAEYCAASMYKEAVLLLIETRGNYAVCYCETSLYLAQIYYLLGDYDAAKKEVEKVLQANDKYLDRAYCVLAQTEYQMGNHETAENILKKAVNDYPNYVNLYLNLISVIDKKDPGKSIEYANHAISRNNLLRLPVIYKEGAPVNTFSFQSAFLPTYKGVAHHLYHSYRTLGNREMADYWRKQEVQIKTESKSCDTVEMMDHFSMGENSYV